MMDAIPEGLNLSNFISDGPVMMFIYSEFKYVWTNKAFQEFLGYSAEEFLGMYFYIPLYGEYKEKMIAQAEARARGEIVANRNEVQVITKNGEQKWISIFIVDHMLYGKRYVMFGAIDITDRKNAEIGLKAAHDYLDQLVQERTQELTLSNNALIAKENLLMSIISNISDGVMIITSEGEIVFINENLKNMLGKNVIDLSNKIDYEMLAAKNPHIERMLLERIAFTYEEVLLTIDGRDLRFLASGTPMEDSVGPPDKGILVLKPLAEIHQLVNRYSGSQARFNFEDILTQSPIMLDTIESAKNASHTNSTILIQGESGTGKELFAQAIHNYSRNAEGPFIAVNCGAIPRDLIGSELFGYVEGAFTGARKGGSPGKIELAQGGTLFLDEIGDMPLEQQVVLLRVLQDKQVCRLGGSKTIPVDVRVICATNQNLFKSVQQGTFRQDLFYRLNVINLLIPPLREHPEDIELLLKHFLAQGDKNWLDHLVNFDPYICFYLRHYQWPGNVRELQNFAEKIHFTVKDYSIKLENLPYEIRDSFRQYNEISPLPTTPHSIDIKKQLADVECHQIKLLLQQFNGNISRVAETLGVSRRTIDRRIKQYGIDRYSL